MKSYISFFKTLGDLNRLRILMLLYDRELCVCQLIAILKISQPLVSRNLSILEKDGLLISRKNGKLVYYRISDQLSTFAKDILDRMALEFAGQECFTSDLAQMRRLCTMFTKDDGSCDTEKLRIFLSSKESVL